MKLNDNILPWKDVLNLTDTEFCQKLNITPEVFFLYINYQN